MALNNSIFTGYFDIAGKITDSPHGSGTTVSHGILTTVLSEDQAGNISGTWSFSGTTTFTGTDPKTGQVFSSNTPDHSNGTAGGTINHMLFFVGANTQVGEATLIGTNTLSGAVFGKVGAIDILYSELIISADKTDSGGVVQDPIVNDGSTGVDTISGGTGNDSLDGGAGNDIIEGNFGNDAIDGGADKDALFGGSGDDTLGGDDGNDKLFGGIGNDKVLGGSGEDIVVGGKGDDDIEGDNGDDSLDGGAGDDSLVGGSGSDTLAGGFGNDTYYVSDLEDLVVETDNLPEDGSGLVLEIDLSGAIDTVIASINYTLGNYIENLTLSGSTAKLTGTGNELDNVIKGSALANTLIGNDGADTIDGGAGADKLTGGAGADTFRFSSLASGSADTISDFSDEDVIAFDISVFTRLVDPASGNLAIGAKAKDVDDYLIYNKGKLYYDADGSGKAPATLIVGLKGTDVKTFTFEDCSFF